MLYGTECRAVKCQKENKLNITKIKISCWISGHTRQDKTRNELIRES